jgi:dipeptidyl-peptidase-4
VAKGYIYFALDNRGSENRGVDFGSAIWHAMGTVEVEDQLAGAAVAEDAAYVDPKIATVRLVLWRLHDAQDARSASRRLGGGHRGAPVTKWELYDTAYTERYLGNPRQVQVYKAAGALDKPADQRSAAAGPRHGRRQRGLREPRR